MSNKTRDKLNREPTQNEKMIYELAKAIERLETSQRSFAMNLGAVARGIGISPKNFVKYLYDDKSNNKFYSKVVVHESKRVINKGRVSLFTKLINKLKGMFMSKQHMVSRVVSQEDLDLNPDLVKEGVKVGDTVQLPETKEETEARLRTEKEMKDKEKADKKAAKDTQKTGVTSAPSSDIPVTYMGVEVTAILSEGESETEYHCRMANGTTMHVPKTLFGK